MNYVGDVVGAVCYCGFARRAEPSTSFEDVYRTQTAEITRLRAEVEALKLERTAAELVHRETATTVLMQMAEVQRLRDAARGVCDRARASQWAAGEDALVPASRLDALLAALEGK